MKRLRWRRWAVWLAGAVVVVAAAAVGGTFLYIHVISGPAPAPLTLKPAKSSSPAPGGLSAPASVTGSWAIAPGSVVGYRVQEVLVGQSQVAVGRTSAISGHVAITGTAVTAASFTVPMATITSNESQRDVQFRGRIMDTAAYPTGTLVLTRPIALAPLPATDVVRTYSASANLTLHGVTRPVTFPLSAELTGNEIEVSGSIPILFADWDIPNPSFTGFVTTQNHGELEFLLKLARS
jgi:polyisoprenoid-binding protein YceI